MSRICLLLLLCCLPGLSHAEWNKRAVRIKAPTAQNLTNEQPAHGEYRQIVAARRPAVSCLEILTPNAGSTPVWACP